MTRRPFKPGQRFRILQRDNFRCRYCGASGAAVELHVDHVWPVILGGRNEDDNLVTACKSCNLGKRDGVLDELPPPPLGEGMIAPAGGWPNEIEAPVYWTNVHWAVTGYGLECLTRPYTMFASMLGSGITVDEGWIRSFYLNYIHEKVWLARDFDYFVEAFRAALRIHRVQYTFDLERSIEACCDEIERDGTALAAWRLGVRSTSDDGEGA